MEWIYERNVDVWRANVDGDPSDGAWCARWIAANLVLAELGWKLGEMNARHLLQKVLAKHRGNRARSAKWLGVSRPTLATWERRLPGTSDRVPVHRGAPHTWQR